MKVDRFYVKYGNIKLNCRSFIADMHKKYPTIILCHEFGLNMLSSVRYAKELCRAGYAVIVFDFSGSGSGLSKGRLSVNMSVLTEKEDLSAVFEYVKSLDYVDENKIVLGGASQGGLVAALFAAEHKNDICSIILYYPALCIPDDARRGCMLGKKIDTVNMPNKFLVMGFVMLGRKYIEDAISLDPWCEISSFEKPVLICHGTDDGIVDISYARKAASVYKDCKLIEFVGAVHGFVKPLHVKAAIKETIEFLG